MKNVDSRRGFTLVELLVVIGIIALLMSILLPTLGRVKERANAIKCSSNLREIGTAVVAYVNNERGYLPLPAVIGIPRVDDVLHWQPGRDMNDSAIARYMGQMKPEIWRCPSDQFGIRIRNAATTPYSYSYTMNYWLMNRSVSPSKQIKLSTVVAQTQKFVFFEEDENTIDDCYCSPQQGTEINLLAIRHDRDRKYPDNPTTGLTINGDRRGNAVFCDGHVEYISRLEIHTPSRYLPTAR